MGRVATGPALAMTVESDSREGVWYTVLLHADGGFSCDCPGYVHHDKYCKHIRRQREELTAERARLRKVAEVFRRYDRDDVQRRLAELEPLRDASE